MSAVKISIFTSQLNTKRKKKGEKNSWKIFPTALNYSKSTE